MPRGPWRAGGHGRDGEMAVRIAAHRARRSEGWRVVEAPLGLGAALAAMAGGVVLCVAGLPLLRKPR